MSYRLAIYFAPDAREPLWRKAAGWLGRDPLSGATFEHPIGGISRDELQTRSVSARRYGFHATIKSPMRLSESTDEAALATALTRFAAAHPPVSVGRLKLASIDGFLALIPEQQPQQLTDFAARVVEAFEPFRAPLDEADKARRNEGGQLTERQLELLERYGYPFVMEQFQFHMTLTDRLAEPDRERFATAAAEFFGPLATAQAVLDRLVLYHEAEPGAPFTRGAEFILSGKAAP